MELVKYYAYSPVKVNMTYYRDSNAKEIDLLIEENNSIHPVEIKRAHLLTVVRSGNSPL